MNLKKFKLVPLTLSLTMAFSGVAFAKTTHHVLEKDGVFTQYDLEELGESYVMGGALYEAYKNGGDLVGYVDDVAGYLTKDAVVSKYVALKSSGLSGSELSEALQNEQEGITDPADMLTGIEVTPITGDGEPGEPITVGEDGQEVPGGEVEFVVKSVRATTDTINSNTQDTQQLMFAINDEAAPADQEAYDEMIAKLTENDYAVEFLASKTGVTRAGVIASNELSGLGNSFTYVVSIKKDGVEVANSGDEKTVSVLDYSTAVTAITGHEISLSNTVVVQSGTLVLGDDASFTNVTGTLKDKTTKDLIGDTFFTFKSLTPTIATVAAGGKINLIRGGTARFELTAGEATRTVEITVATEKRAVASATVNPTSLENLTTNDESAIAVNLTDVKDQYGDFYPCNFVLEEPKTTGASPTKLINVDTAAGTKINETGTGSFTVTENDVNGEGILQVTFDGTLLRTIPVKVVTAGEVATRRLETVSGENYAIVNNKIQMDMGTLAGDDTVALVYNTYDADDLKVGPEKEIGATNETYIVESSDTNVATITVDTKGVITIKAEGVGSTTINVKEGSFVRASIEVEVSNSDPKIIGVTFENNIDPKKYTVADAVYKMEVTDILKLDNIILDKTVSNKVYDTDSSGGVNIKVGGKTELVVGNIRVQSCIGDDRGSVTFDADSAVTITDAEGSWTLVVGIYDPADKLIDNVAIVYENKTATVLKGEAKVAAALSAAVGR